jgi:hypothetical protein
MSAQRIRVAYDREFEKASQPGAVVEVGDEHVTVTAVERDGDELVLTVSA